MLQHLMQKFNKHWCGHWLACEALQEQKLMLRNSVYHVLDVDLSSHTIHNWLAYCIVYENVTAAMKSPPVDGGLCLCPDSF
jgi:hypothetical protein